MGQAVTSDNFFTVGDVGGQGSYVITCSLVNKAKAKLIYSAKDKLLPWKSILKSSKKDSIRCELWPSNLILWSSSRLLQWLQKSCRNAKYSKKRQLEREDAGLTTEKHQPSHIQLQVLLPAAIDLLNLFWKYRWDFVWWQAGQENGKFSQLSFFL